MIAQPVRSFAPRTYTPNQKGIPTHEAPLQRAAAFAARSFAVAETDPILVIPELDVGGVRPDLWIGTFDEKVLEERANRGVEACTAPYPLAIAHTLRRLGCEAKIDSLASPPLRLGTIGRVRRGLSELVRRRIAFRDGDKVILDEAFRSAGASGVAVEAKIDRWKRALRQVQMWRNLVNGAYLVFPEAYLDRVPRSHPGLRGVGLASVDDRDVLRVVRKARTVTGHSFNRMLLEEHIYARWLVEEQRHERDQKGVPARTDRVSASRPLAV